MKIGIIGAMKIEVEKLCDMAENVKKEKIGGIEFCTGTLCGHEVVIAVCGVGKVFAAMCAQAMILHHSPDMVINTGVAGGLSPSLHLLDVAISTAVVQHDMDTSPLGDPVGLISGINRVELPASASLGQRIAKAAASLGKYYEFGVIASGDQFIADPTRKDTIADTFGAIACEMEGAAIGQVCYVNGVDFVILRAISDHASDEAGSLEYPELCQKAAEASQKLIEAFFKL